MTQDDWSAYNAADKCFLCNKEFKCDKGDKCVRCNKKVKCALYQS